MYITVPLKNKRQKIASKQHQQLLFKEIQYNKISQKTKLQDELRKSNRHISFHKNTFFKGSKQNILKKSATCATFRNRSFQKKKIHNQVTHRPSVTSIIDENQEFCPNRLLKTTGQIFKQKKHHYNLRNDQNIFIDEKYQEKKTDKQNDINTFSSKQELQKMFKQNFSKSLDQSMIKKKLSPNKLSTRRKNYTILDLKIKNIQQIIHKAGKNHGQQFSSLVEQDEKKIKDWGWKGFYNAVDKRSPKKQTTGKQKILRLKRTAASDHIKNITAKNNPIHKIFVKQKKQNEQASQKQSEKKQKKLSEKETIFKKDSTFTSENMFKFFNFVKGVQNHDQYSKDISMPEYRNQLQKFYVLRNSERAIKQTENYKNITMGNFTDHSRDQLLSFVYMNENQYKLKAKKI